MGRRIRRTAAAVALASAASLTQNASKSWAFSPGLEPRPCRGEHRNRKIRHHPGGPGVGTGASIRTTSTGGGTCTFSRSPRTIQDRPSTHLHAFWARGTDAGPADETKRSGNSLLRKILPRGDGSPETDSSSSTSVSRRKRTTGRSSSSVGSGSNRTRTKSSSARYYYSAAALNEQCPSWAPGADVDECPIDEGVWGSYDDVAAAAVSADLMDNANISEQQRQKAASRLVEDALDGFVHRHALHTMNLKITSDATSRSAVLLRGELGTVHASFDRLSFPALKLSGGGRISATGLTLNTASFVPALGRFVRRWGNSFEFHAHDCTLTQEDLRTSRAIRIGLANVGTRILRKVVASDSSLDVVRIDRGARLSVSKVEIMENSMLSAKGFITTILGNSIPFAVQTGIRVSNGGHVLHFPGLQVILNPRSPLQTHIPLHLVHQVDLDLGDNASIGSVEIDGRRKVIRVSATATVTPKSASVGKAAHGVAAVVKRAKYAVDMGRWLTNLGRFTT
mmetsp:Transcript_30048/g.65059  ORF Transcript_30048/g.65059 Transcript_30048/m.65059 type:complete len:509 (-) Transcript_30048:75-1601(-)